MCAHGGGGKNRRKISAQDELSETRVTGKNKEIFSNTFG
jgi:hypothetical protein